MAAAYQPLWLAVEDVKAWLRVLTADTTEDDLIAAAAAMTEPYVERCRPEWLAVDDTDPENPVVVYEPDAETYQGAVMYAAREYRRRNSPAGIETFGDATSFVSRWDPDIDRALQTGSYAPAGGVMTDPLVLMDAYLAALTNAGIRSAVDGRDINPPAVQLRAPALTYRFGRGCVEAAWTARLILPNTGQRNALAEAIPLLERIQEALQGAVVSATPTDFELPDGGGPVPGYTLTWTTH